MGFGMGQIETSPQGMTELVVQRHGHMAQHLAAQPRAIQRLGASSHVLGVAAEPRQGLRNGRHACFRHQAHDGVTVRRVQAFRGMCHSIHAARDRQAQRQSERECRVVQHRSRQHAWVASGLFDTPFGDAEDGGHLRARVGGGNRDDGQAGIEGNRLAQSNGGAATHGHGHIGSQVGGSGTGCTCGFYRHVHDGLIKNARRTLTQLARHTLGHVTLLWGTQHKRTLGAQGLHLGSQRGQTTFAKHDAPGQ